jgi:large repetitive protein
VIAADPGGAPVTYSAVGLPNGLTINPTTGVITGTVAYDAAGPHVVTITVTKGTLTTSDSFNWTILERNTAPTITAPDRTNAEGDLILPIMVATATDPEGDLLIWSATGLPPGLTMLPNGLVSGLISPTGEGVYTVTVSVKDSALGTPISTTFTWTVTGNNRPPTINSVDQFSNEGDTVSYVVAGVDPDGDTLSYTMTGTLPATHSINPATGAITGTFSFQSDGVYTITVRVTDGQYAASTTFLWTVRDINRPPVVNPVDQFSREGDVASYAVPGSDPDNDPLVWTATGLPPGFTISSTGVISGTFGPGSAGVYTINVAVCDALLCATKTFLWTVGANLPPTVFHADRTNVEGDTVSYATTASDPDGDTLTFTATGLPPGISINPANGQLTGTLGYNTAGTYTPTITVSDGRLSAAHTFNWIVTNTNRPPDAVNDAASVNQGASVTIAVLNLDTDPDDDTLTVTAITQPASGQGTAVLNADGTVTYTAPANFSGTTTFTYTISDGNGGTDTATVTVTVADVNYPPTVFHANRTNIEGDTVSYATTASDPDGDTLTFTATGLPAGISINPANGQLTGTLGFNTAGTYNPTITVSDGRLTATHTFNWIVTNTNRPPDAVNDTASTNPGASVTVTVLNLDSDPDGDTLTVTAITQPASGQGTAVLNANGTVTYSAPLTFTGTTTFTYTISDGNGGTDTATVTVTVANASCSAGGYTTYSQGGWGNNGAPGQLMQANFTRVYPSGFVIIGGTKTLKFTSAGAVTAFLPQGGTPAMLTASAINPTSSTAGNFAAQVFALRLAVDYSAAGVLKSGLGSLVMVSGPFANQTVNQVLATANAVLGGSASALPSGMTVSQLNSIVESLNLNFHEGTVNNGLLACPTGPVVTQNHAPVAGDDSATTKKNKAVTINVLANDSDSDGDALTITLGGASNCTITKNANNTITFTPANNYKGTTTFTYSVSDGKGGSDVATVTVKVTN